MLRVTICDPELLFDVDNERSDHGSIAIQNLARFPDPSQHVIKLSNTGALCRVSKQLSNVMRAKIGIFSDWAHIYPLEATPYALP
jgi:hypothetical protein